MALDTRYVVAYHHCRRCSKGETPCSRGPMDSATTGFSGPLLFGIPSDGPGLEGAVGDVNSLARLFARTERRGYGWLPRADGCCITNLGIPLKTSCSWSLTASYSTGPQIRNRCRAMRIRRRATRVQGLSLVVTTRLSPLRAHTGLMRSWVRPHNSLLNQYQEGKRKSESCHEFELK